MIYLSGHSSTTITRSGRMHGMSCCWVLLVNLKPLTIFAMWMSTAAYLKFFVISNIFNIFQGIVERFLNVFILFQQFFIKVFLETNCALIKRIWRCVYRDNIGNIALLKHFRNLFALKRAYVSNLDFRSLSIYIK